MKFVTAIALIAFSVPAFAADKTLNLNEYLGQVGQGNKGIQGSKARGEGAALKSEEGYLLTSPMFFMNGSKTVDQSEKSNITFQGTKTENTSYSLGFSQQTSFGLTGKLSQTLMQTTLTGADQMFISVPNYYESKTMLELSQSLWRNGFGSETSASVDAAEAGAKVVQYQESFAVKVAQSQAEVAYWRLSLARAVRIVQSDSLDRSRKIREWNLKRFQNQLADKSDFLQADAAFRLRDLDYQVAADEERTMSRQFNSLRGVNSDTVTEILEPLPRQSASDLKRASKRDDVLASEEGMKVAQAQSQLGLEKAKPTLDVFGSYSLNGKDVGQSAAMNESTTNSYPVSTIGLRFAMPLDFGTVSDVKDGYRKESLAAEMKHQRKLFEQEEEWSGLTKKLQEAQKRLALAAQFEDAQKAKYEYERLRQSKGRSTIFYVLQFEQEFAAAQVNRLKAQTEVLTLVAQMKTFGGTP